MPQRFADAEAPGIAQGADAGDQRFTEETDLVQQALDTTITVFIESVQNIFPSSSSKVVAKPSEDDVAIWDSSDDEAVSILI